MPRKGYKQTAEHRAKISEAARLRAQPGHGMRDTRVYWAWSSMKQRCFNVNHHRYADYGGRGITVCDRWLTFENFLADMGEPGPGLSLDRIDNERGYEPSNCHWTTAEIQAGNRRNPRPPSRTGRRRCATCGMLACRCKA